MAGLEAEGARHAAAARIHHVHLEVRHQPQQVGGRLEQTEALLVTMSVHQRAVRRDRPKLEIQPATFVLTQQELLEQERLPRQRRRLVARQQVDRTEENTYELQSLMRN